MLPIAADKKLIWSCLKRIKLDILIVSSFENRKLKFVAMQIDVWNDVQPMGLLTHTVWSIGNSMSTRQWRAQKCWTGGGQKLSSPPMETQVYTCARNAPRALWREALKGWDPGARLRAPGGVQGQSPAGGPVPGERFYKGSVIKGELYWWSILIDSLVLFTT